MMASIRCHIEILVSVLRDRGKVAALCFVLWVFLSSLIASFYPLYSILFNSTKGCVLEQWFSKWSLLPLDIHRTLSGGSQGQDCFIILRYYL